MSPPVPSPLRPPPGARVAVLVASDGAEEPALPRELDGIEATRVAVDRPRKAFGVLAGIGPLDLLVDACADPAGEPERFEQLFPLVADGGRYLVLPGATTRRWRRPHPELRALLDGLAPEHPLAAAVGSSAVDAGSLAVVRRGRVLAKVREGEMDQALAADPSRGRIVTSVPAVSFDSRCAFRASTEERRDRTKARYDAPVVRLREYHDVVCGPRSVVVQRNLLTPDTFRHHQAPRLFHAGLTDAGERFVEPPFDDAAAPALPGRWYHLDNENRGHFGHLMTEQLSRVWAWPEAKAADPELRVLVTVNRGHRLAAWEGRLLEAAGIGPDDLEVVEGPVRVDRLLAPTPMFSMPQYVHPAITASWDRTGETLRSWGPPGPTPRRIFCTRTHRLRACRNREVVEALFAEHGFAIVSPEELSLTEQAWMFHEAEVVAGFAGSALFNVLLTDRPKHLVLVSSDTYGPSNEYMIAALRGHRLDLAVSRAVRRSGPKARAYQAPFTFDPEREGVWLRRVLEGLRG